MIPETSDLRILMFPWLAHGHIFPFLQLAKRIVVQKNFHVHLCTTAVNFPSIHSFIRSNGLDRAVDLVELHLEPSPELPPHYHTTKNLPPHLNFTLLKAFKTAKPSFSEILAALRPDLVVYDLHQPWAPRMALSRGIPAVYFSIGGAASMAYGHHQYTSRDDNFPFPELCVEDHEREHLDRVVECCRTHVFEGDKDGAMVNFNLSCDVILAKTSMGFEGKYVDYVSGFAGKKFLPVGPLVTDPSSEEDSDSDILRWLNKKGHHSTVYISFGSEHFLSKDEIAEMAKGLELSGVNFIWVVRFPLEETTMTVEEALPEGFLDRVQDRGIVVSGWAPQAKILQHPSTGAFISHCGWSSVVESMYFGVPIIAMPMKLIMFIDANMLVAAGVGVRVPKKENHVYEGDRIADAISKVIAGENGDGLRWRAQELSGKMRAEEETAIQSGAEELWQICLKQKMKNQDMH